MAILPPASCTARVTTWWRLAEEALLMRPASGLTQPAMLGEKPPVTIRPTPPSARSRK